MATADKRRRWSPRRKRAPSEAKGNTTAAKASATDQPEAAPVIKKGIYLSALFYVEGEQAAPEDFTALTTKSLREKLQPALKQQDDALRITLKKLEVRNDVEQEEDGEDKAEEKFQF